MSAALPRQQGDQRKSLRVPLILPGRISVPGDRLILDCTLTDLSAGGAGLCYEAVAPRAELVGQLEIGDFGCFDGITTRNAGHARGFRFVCGEAYRNNLMPKMIQFISAGLAETGKEKRKYPRSEGGDYLQMRLPSGQREQCRVIDISLDSIYLSTDSRPPIGHLVRVGQLYGRVQGYRERGIVLKFISVVIPSPNGTLLSEMA